MNVPIVVRLATPPVARVSWPVPVMETVFTVVAALNTGLFVVPGMMTSVALDGRPLGVQFDAVIQSVDVAPFHVNELLLKVQLTQLVPVTSVEFVALMGIPVPVAVE